MTMRTFTRPAVLVAALAVAAVLLLAACGSPTNVSAGASSATPAAGGTAAAGGATTNAIAIQNFTFTPASTTVKAGTTVTWTNNDTTPHNVMSADGPGTDAATTSTFASKTMAQGDTFSFTFKKPGTYYYECTIHASMASMHAVVIVK